MILQRYILRQLVITTLFIFIAVSLVIFIGTSFQLMRAFESLGLDLLKRLAPIVFIVISPHAFLVSTTAATTLVYGRLAAENEILAMRVSGVHLHRFIAPALLWGLLLSLVTYYFNDYLVPNMFFQRRQALQEAVASLLKSPPPDKNKFSLGNYSFSYEYFKDGVFIAPFIVEIDREHQLRREYHAKEAELRIVNNVPQLTLRKCSITVFEIVGGEKRDDTIYMEGEFTLELDKLEEVKTPEKLQEMDSLALQRYINSATLTQEKRKTAQTELYTRRSNALAVFFLVLVAVPIGVFVRRGSKLAGLGASLPPILLYFLVSVAGEGLGGEAAISPYLAAFACDGALFLVALPLYYWLYKK